jgi:hypothetical protein
MGHRLATLLLVALAACGDAGDEPSAPREPPPLPGVAEGVRDWSWRDVLARPLDGEAAPRVELLALQPATARMDALADLAADDPAAPATLMAALRDPQDAVAALAAELLADGRHLHAVPRLVLGLGPYPVDYDVPVAVRCAEAAALARLGSPAGVPLILMLLAEGTSLQVPEGALPWSRTERIVYLQELALPGLRALAGTDFGFRPGSPVPDREAAVTAARAWWDAERPALWTAAPADDPGLLARARLVIAHLSAYQLRQVDAARFVLTNLGPGILPLLEEGLRDGDQYARVTVLEVAERLAGVCDGKDRARLANLAARPLLEDASTTVAVQAAAACGAARVADQLVVALEQRREPEVVIAVLDALGRSGQPAALATLQAYEAGPDAAALPADGRAALQAALLAADPSRDPQPFLDLLASADPDLAFAALQRLIALTGSDCGLDPAQPPGQRVEAISRAGAALASRGQP